MRPKEPPRVMGPYDATTHDGPRRVAISSYQLCSSARSPMGALWDHRVSGSHAIATGHEPHA